MSAIKMEDDKLTLEYNLADLPSAQHKAGLAGLLVMIESLKRRKKSPLPETRVSQASAEITFTKEALRLLSDDLYDSQWIEIDSKQKWTNKKPKRIEEIEIDVDGKTKKEKRFIYDDVKPKGAFLQVYYPDGDGLWIKLWRDMLWNILRGIPTTRNVYNERADNKPSSETDKIWNSFAKSFKAKQKGTRLTSPLSSSLFIGAEADNPEKIPFVGPVEDNFLLNFWTIVSLIHVPWEIKIERKEDQIWVNQSSEMGYVLSIPEPNHLEYFCEDVIDVLRSLDTAKSAYRPRSARIDIFEESGLECLYYFTRRRIDDAGGFSTNLHTIEMYHMQKKGNRTRQLAASRIHPDVNMIKEYAQVRDSMKNPFFKKMYLPALISGEAWHDHADMLFYNAPAPIFVHSAKTPKKTPFFGKDVRNKFVAIDKNLEIRKGGDSMNEKDHDDQLARRIFRLIRNYVFRKAEEKSGKRYEEFKNNKNEKGYVKYPPEYRETLEKVCMDAFLAMRGRREQDFIEYFTGTICSVPQFLPEEEYIEVAKDLMEEWRKIKNLSMLAISANSYVSTSSTQKEE